MTSHDTLARRQRRAWTCLAGLTAAVLLVSGCLTDGRFVLQGPGLPPSGTDPLPGAVSPPVAPAPGLPATPETPVTVVQGTAAFQGTALPGASVTVFRVSTATPVTRTVTTDAQGAFTAPLLEPLAPGTVLLVTARKDAMSLASMVLTTARMTTQNAQVPVVAGTVQTDLATTLVTKRLLPKLAEVLLSRSPGDAGTQRLVDLFTRAGEVLAQVTATLSGPVRDDRLRAAIDAVMAQPDDARIERLAQALVQYGEPQAAFLALVDAAHQALLHNLQAGGAAVGPRPWQVGTVRAAIPRLQAVGSQRTRLDHGPLAVTVDRPLSAFFDVPAVITWLEQLLFNDTAAATAPVPSGGGGGGAAGPPAVPPVGVDAGLTVEDGASPVLAGSLITRYAGTGADGFSGDGGAALTAQFYAPSDVAVDRAGHVYVADFYNLRVRRIDRQTLQISTVAGSGATGSSSNVGGFSGDGGAATSARLSWVAGLAFDSRDNLYIADAANRRIRRVNAADGTIETVAGSGTSATFIQMLTCQLNPAACALTASGDGGAATSARLSIPAGLAIDGQDHLYIADSLSHRVRRVDAVSGTITTIAGTGTAGGAGDSGQATAAQLNNPSGLAFDRLGHLYVSEFGGHRVRRIDMTTGVITTIAGTGAAGFAGDDGPATAAQLNGPMGLEVDRAGNVYVAERNNSRVRRIEAGTGIIRTFMGGGAMPDGFPPQLATLWSPTGVAVDGQGAVYVTDRGNPTVRVVR